MPNPYDIFLHREGVPTIYVRGPIYGYDIITNKDGTVTQTRSVDGVVTHTTTYETAEDSPLGEIFAPWMLDLVREDR